VSFSRFNHTTPCTLHGVCVYHVNSVETAERIELQMNAIYVHSICVIRRLGSLKTILPCNVRGDSGLRCFFGFYWSSQVSSTHCDRCKLLITQSVHSTWPSLSQTS